MKYVHNVGKAMQFEAKARYVKYSPYKLRPLVNVIRGKNVAYALNWLKIYRNQRSLPVKKVLESAAANAQYLKSYDPNDLMISEIKVDQGPARKYFKPAAMGRAMIQRKRLSHISVILKPKQ